MGSAFTLTLANIFMWKWEKTLARRLTASNEIYSRYAFQVFFKILQLKPSSIFCRYIDDIFFTSNESLETTHQMLDEANQFHPNIKLIRQIGKSISFLDVFIENNNGVLATSVYHKEMSEPYIVPF